MSYPLENLILFLCTPALIFLILSMVGVAVLETARSSSQNWRVASYPTLRYQLAPPAGDDPATML